MHSKKGKLVNHVSDFTNFINCKIKGVEQPNTGKISKQKSQKSPEEDST